METEIYSERFGGYVDAYADDEGERLAFTCSKCGVCDLDEAHWENGKHICGADW